ncbi:group 1 truncated hemoglobin [Bacteriovorax sp. DB6_IX]|uniref:group I truncated hemoglobin n=1 Tax=Bacteriovorax sp. DB6_IX TaxID=1353530 RepID=UPI00038A29E1|nr:group 1 truncated hemoglobin [Bacteriovorax sp. DB6_IX]EQC51432.1 globin, protozoan/cyanobacterial family [Bacteriovorax sp. DB6_IX]
MEQSIYQKYGGYNTIYNIIYELYLELCDHPEIAIHFVGVDLDRLIKLQTQFVSRALGAEIEYMGRPLKRAHHFLDITNFQYNEVQKIFTKLFIKNGFSEEDVKVVKELLIAEREKIVTAKWSFYRYDR